MASNGEQVLRKLSLTEFDEGLQSRVDALRRRYAALKTRIETFAGSPDGSLISEVVGLQNTQEAISTMLDDLENSDVVQGVSDLEDAVHESARRIGTISPAVEKLPALRSKLEQLEIRLEPIIDGKTGADAVLVELTNTLGNIQTSLEEFEGTRHQMSLLDRIDVVETTLREVSEQVDTVVAQYGRLKDVRASLSDLATKIG
jgi:hypothetical protein